MSFPYIQKTLRWRNLASPPSQRARGFATLLAIFLYFLFTALGLGLLHLSRIYFRLGIHKKNTALLTLTTENGIKAGYDFLSMKVAGRAPLIINEEHFAELQQNAASGGDDALREALAAVFPIHLEESDGKQTWASSVSFSLRGFVPAESHFLADFGGSIESEGKLEHFLPKKKSSLRVSVKTAAGHIPLAYFPLLLDQSLTPEKQQELLSSPVIQVLSPSGNLSSRGVNFSPQPLIARNPDPALAKALNIKSFSPGKLTRAELRRALGLEMVDEPVPDGVYLISNDTGLGGVFVQGDLDEMILAIDAGFQVISFRRGPDHWLLKFSPALGKTLFSTPATSLAYDRVPLGMILVNGKIASLGGGIMNASEVPELLTDEKVPCILQGVSLTIVSSDQITLTSHLIQQGVK
jgi:hypothetical protein